MKIKRRNSKKPLPKQVKGDRRKSDPVKKARLQNRALQLRIEGKTYQEIANEIGYAKATSAHRFVMEAIQAINEQMAEKVSELRTLELNRLDRLIQKLEKSHKLKEVIKEIGRGSKKTTIKVKEREVDTISFIYAYIRLMDRRAQYIAGLNAPKQFEADVGGKLKEQMEVASVELVDLLKQISGEK